MPSQLFTLARKFQAASNGKIFIGKIDTDPTLPENQIQVYLENEDGSHIPVPQPLIINQAGFPVFGGQIAKFVTVEGHSMAVYDSYGVLQFYYPNILKYDPDQFEKRFLDELSKKDSEVDIAGMTAGDLVKNVNENTDDIKKIKKRIVSLHPSIPSTQNSIKLIMRPLGINGFIVVTKKSRGRGGYIATSISNDVASSDDNNFGGKSNWRPNTVRNITKCYIGNTVATKKGAGVTQPNFEPSFIRDIYGIDMTSSSAVLYSESIDCMESNLKTPMIYSVPVNDFIEFSTIGETTLKLMLSAHGADKVIVRATSESWSMIIATVNTSTSSTSPAGSIDILIPKITKGVFSVRVENASSDDSKNAYVAGCNIMELCNANIDTFATNGIACLASEPNRYYRKSNGANEFAAREPNGKWFGTYHGGHTPILERLRCSNNANYDVNENKAPHFLLTEFVNIYSNTELTIPSLSGVYSVICNWSITDGAEFCNYSISLKSGVESKYDSFYSHMNTTSTEFTYTLIPQYKSSLLDGNNPIGDHNCIYQQSPLLSCYSLFTQLDQENNYLNGANIQKTINFNKQYYGTCMGGGKTVDTIIGDYVTYKEFF